MSDAPTAELMIEFYRQLQTNPGKVQALRWAMFITMQQLPDPKDWAAFTLLEKRNSCSIRGFIVLAFIYVKTIKLLIDTAKPNVNL